jgi:hypothetical protein
MQFGKTQFERENYADHRSLDHDSGSKSHLDCRGSAGVTPILLDLCKGDTRKGAGDTSTGGGWESVGISPLREAGERRSPVRGFLWLTGGKGFSNGDCT